MIKIPLNCSFEKVNTDANPLVVKWEQRVGMKPDGRQSMSPNPGLGHVVLPVMLSLTMVPG
jgi:hypothetical protein